MKRITLLPAIVACCAVTGGALGLTAQAQPHPVGASPRAAASLSETIPLPPESDRIGPASGTVPNPCRSIPGTFNNPARHDVKGYLEQHGAERDLPPQLLKAIAYQESSWRQFNASGRPLVSFDGGIGMMQLTGATARQFNVPRLCTDWKYNIDAGMTVLKSKATVVESKLPTAAKLDRALIENWMQATHLYNGVMIDKNTGKVYRGYIDRIVDILRHPGGKNQATWLKDYLAPQPVTTAYDVNAGYDWPQRLSATAAGKFRFYKDKRLVTTKNGAVHRWHSSPDRNTVVDNGVDSTQLAADRVLLLTRSGDELLRREYQPSTGTFTAWETMKGATVKSAPAAAAWSDGTINVFANGVKTNTFTRLIRSNGTWLAPQTFGTPTQPAFRPDIVSPTTGQFIVAYTDTAGVLRVIRYANGNWGDWEKLGSGFVSAPTLAVKDGVVTVMAATNSTTLWYRVLNIKTNTWSPVGTVKTPAMASQSSPGFAVRPNGQLVVAIRGANSHLYKNTHHNGEKWEAFTDLSSSGATALSSSPVVMAPNNDQIVVAARGAAGVPHYTTWSTGNQWNAWKPMK